MDYGTTTGNGVYPETPAIRMHAPSGTGAPADRTGTSHRPRSGRPQVPSSLLLVAVLAVQAVLSLRLAWSNTAYQDEAMYLWAGHLEWAHWLHGASVPPYPAYFTGAPVLYPPIGALADAVGGLAGARILSLCLALGATALLWGTAGRLYGRRAAFFAAALFAVLGPTLHVGAFATGDALSLLLVALAAWCVARAGEREDATGWMLAAGAALALANAVAYPSLLLDPVVIALALCTAYPKPGGKLAAGRAAILLTVVVTFLIASALIGGSYYVTGMQNAVLRGVAGTNSPLTVLTSAWSWTGLIFIVAGCGVAISRIRGERPARTWLLAALAGAALIVPLEQAALRTTMSLSSRVDAGAWFAAIAAGYAADRVIAAARLPRMRALTCAACVVSLALPVSLGLSQSWAIATSWPRSSSFTAIFRPLADRGTGRLLVEDPSLAEYYLPAGTQWQRWSSTRNIVLTAGNRAWFDAGNAGNFARFIADGYFSMVAVNFSDTMPLDHSIRADLRHNPHYQVIDVVPYGLGTYVIWRYEAHPAPQPGYEPRLGTPVKPHRKQPPRRHQ
jgi:Dolichyl-phosphate-mannose-protein mannosyltransferase